MPQSPSATGQFQGRSRDGSITVSVGHNGAWQNVRLESAAMELADGELAARIVRLNTLACLRSRMDQRRTGEGAIDGIDAPTAQQVGEFAKTIEF